MSGSKMFLSFILLLPAFAGATDRVWRNFLYEEKQEVCSMNRPIVYSKTSLELCANHQPIKIRPQKQAQEVREEEPRLFWR